MLNNLQKLRARAGLTQEQVAQKIGTSKVNISRHETGAVTNIPMHWLEKYTKVYNCTANDIINLHGLAEDNGAAFSTPSHKKTPEQTHISHTLLVEAGALCGQMAEEGLIPKNQIQALASEAAEVASNMQWPKVSRNLILTILEYTTLE